MSGRLQRGRAGRQTHHAEFKPVTGSFEFTGENQRATRRRGTADGSLARAAVAVLLRIGS
jgi:hypothetical protein